MALVFVMENIISQIQEQIILSKQKWVSKKRNEFMSHMGACRDSAAIPFEGLELSDSEIKYRNDIYTKLFINKQLTKENIYKFVSNSHLFIDINDINTLHLIKDCLKNIDDKEQLKLIMNNILNIVTKMNTKRQQFNKAQFITNYSSNIPFTGMSFREHGQPYKKLTKTQEDMIHFGASISLSNIMNDHNSMSNEKYTP